MHREVPRLAADLAVLHVVLLFSAARIECNGAHLPAIGAGDIRLEVGNAVAERELLVERIRWSDHRDAGSRGCEVIDSTSGVVFDMGI
jgi:hypothetical protein